MRIEKKTWPEYFEKLADGEKTFDCRIADFECKVGDTLVFREWDPKTKAYTGRKVEKEVSYVLNTKEAAFWKMEDIDRFGFLIAGLKCGKIQGE